MRNPLEPEDLRRIIKRWDSGEGFDAAVAAFAAAVPVASRTVYYWLAGRKMHPVFAARVRQLGGNEWH